MVRSDKEVALEWIEHMRKELEKLKGRIDWLDNGLAYLKQVMEKLDAQKK